MNKDESVTIQTKAMYNTEMSFSWNEKNLKTHDDDDDDDDDDLEPASLEWAVTISRKHSGNIHI